MSKVLELKSIYENMPQPIVDPAFDDCGQQEGIEIWRIESMKVVPVPQKQYGQFYSGDAYIILVSYGKPKTGKWNAHFWLGKDCSQDEQAVAAYKTVELDDSLGGVPVQYREVQGHESKLFLSYFKNGTRYLEGGVASALRNISEIKFTKKLFHVKGKRNCRVMQVEVCVDSLNQGDVFVLDCDKNLFVWTGPHSSIPERTKGAQLAREIRDQERGGKAVIDLIDDEWSRHKIFYNELGSHPGVHIPELDPKNGSDSEFEQRTQSSTKLFKVSDASGEMEITEITERPLKKELLDTEDCFILDMGTSGVYAWVGKRCTKDEKSTVWKKTTEFLKSQRLPDWTPIARVNEGTEPAIFKAALHWPIDIPVLASPTSNVAQIDQSQHRVEVSKLHKKSSKSKEYMPDDGTGEVTVWRVENFTKVPVERKAYGFFYSGDSYIVLYKSNKQNIVYFWQGAKSSVDEIAASAMIAVKVDEEETHGMAIQIRVVQNKEPAHFVKIFAGRIVVLMGGVASGFEFVNEKNTYETDGVRMFQIRDNKIFQVPERATSLNSNDVFLVESPDHIYMWYGKGANEQERSLAMDFPEMVIISSEQTTENVEEGEESEEFWIILGGKAPYASGGSFEMNESVAAARLFHCSNARGYFHIEEIVDFGQQDLIADDVMLLDAYNEIFIWIGKGANEVEKKEAMKTAIEYIKTDPLNRSLNDTQILTIKQGLEPPLFTGHFGAWDPELWNKGMSYEDLKRELGAENVRAKPVEEEMKKYSQFYPLEVLQTETPEGVDATRKEYHLSPEEFESVFGMTVADYDKLQKWKQTDLKKKNGLF